MGQGRLVSSPHPYAEILGPAPDVQHAFAEAADELIRCVRWQNFAEIIKRPAHHGGKLVRRSMLCPAATQLQTSLPICLCVHSPGHPRVRGPGEADAAPGPVRSRQSWKLGGWKESARRAPDKQKLRI